MNSKLASLKKWLIIIAVFVIIAAVMYNCGFYIALAIWLGAGLIALLIILFRYIKKK